MYNNFQNPYPMAGAYNAQPFNTQSQCSILNDNQIIKVNGIEGAKAYQMLPNKCVALFDGSNDIFYLKTTDGAGFATIKAYKFEEMQSPEQAQIEQNFISRKEFNEFKQEVLNGKQHIQQPTNNTNKPTNNSAGKTNDGQRK